MRVIIFIGLMSALIVACLTTGGLAGKNEVPPDPIDARLKEIFGIAKAGDWQTLEKMRSDPEFQTNQTIRTAYPLALYISSPKRYEQEYVETFPENHKGIMDDIFARVETQGLTPHFMYSVDSLGIIATHGNQRAIEKLLKGFGHSDGAAAEAFCDAVARTLSAQTEKTVAALAKLNDEDRTKNYRFCLQPIDELMEEQQIESVRVALNEMRLNATEAENLVIKELERILD